MIDIIIEALDMDMQGTTREITEHVCGRVSKDQILSVGPISGIRKQASVKGEDTVVFVHEKSLPVPLGKGAEVPLPGERWRLVPRISVRSHGVKPGLRRS